MFRVRKNRRCPAFGGIGVEEFVSLRKNLVVLLALLVAFMTAAPFLNAQSLTQGDVAGTVTDPTGAVVPGATVTLKNNNNGGTQTRTTTGTGAYRFPFQQPGNYTLTFTSPSYRTTERQIAVAVGQTTTVNTQLALAATEQTVTVTAEGSVLQADNPNVSTTMSSEQIHLAPNGGGDLSFIAQTSPGSSINVQAGYGNFSSFGIPATSNNFTYNSMPENDPFLSLNNSGATNILLGQNDISEATVVANGYSGQYSMQGANVNYVSRAGTNSYHGNVNWYWNGTYVNANNYFNNLNNAPRGFVNDNQWAASFGGPIKKDKTFFFINTEGLRVIVPVTRRVKVPTTAFENAVLTSVPGSETAFYQNMFNLYNNAPGANRAQNVIANGGCADLIGSGLPAFASFGSANPCGGQFTSTVSDLTHEYLITARVDQNIGANDRAFIHFRTDQGVQATYSDPINPAFNLTSNQPQWEGQLQWVHTLSSTMVNSFSLNGSYYRAIFAQPSSAAALALQPVEVQFAGGTSAGAFYQLGHDFTFPSPSPQGRNVTQYGFVEDFSRTMGKHNIKIGGDFSRFDVTDYGIGSGSLPAISNESLTNFVQGNATTFIQSFPTSTRVPINLYRLGMYLSDQWRVKSNLQLTLTLRADRNSNPNCVTNCLSRLVSDFGSISHNINTPYNQSIITGVGNALPSNYNPWEVQPRFGFNWSPFGPNGNTVISGGFGIFSDVIPAVFIDSMLPNLPNVPTIQVSGQQILSSGATAASAANALRSGFANGATLASLSALVPGFSAPNFFNPGSNISAPRAQKWNLQIQHSIGPKMALSLNYVGNHGIHQEINNTGVNAFCGGPSTNSSTCLGSLGISSFNGLPTAPADPRFTGVTELTTGYNSNYNGVTLSFLRRLSSLQFQLNYTYSHALDYASNNGVGTTPFNFNTNLSITNPVNPFNPFQNMYGNSDYDMRHQVTLNYVWETPKSWMHGFLGGVLSGWSIGGTLFWHTGTPYTIVDSGTGGALNAFGYGGASNIAPFTFANNAGGVGTITCNGTFANPNSGACPGMANNFVPSVTGFGTTRRNQAYGPKFFDTDLTITKNFKIPGREGMTLSVGATAFNLFNHPNFDQPVQDVASGSFGTIQSTVNAPTSIYGSFLGADASPRLLQSQIKLNF